jgi:hypothetical protein
MLCGLLVGGLSWVSVQEGVGLGEIATGIESSAVQVAGVFKPEVFTSNSLFVIDAQEASVLTSIKNQNAGETINPSGEVFANLPVFPVREGSGDADSHKLAVTKQSSLSQRHFSDEIEIIKDEQGREFIEPVFKNGGDAPLRFIVEEVSRQEQ